MKYYWIVLFGTLLGQLFVASVAVYVWQMKNPKVDYLTACGIYINKQIGSFVIILTFVFLILFCLSEWLNLNQTRSEILTRQQLNLVDRVQAFFKTSSVIFGIGVHWLALRFFKNTKWLIQNYGKTKADEEDLKL